MIISDELKNKLSAYLIMANEIEELIMEEDPKHYSNVEKPFDEDIENLIKDLFKKHMFLNCVDLIKYANIYTNKAEDTKAKIEETESDFMSESLKEDFEYFTEKAEQCSINARNVKELIDLI